MATREKTPQCDYCSQPAVVWMKRKYRRVSMGHYKVGTVTSGACAEHETCVSFVSRRERFPDAPVFRA